MADAWTGPRDGPFRGRRLYRCPLHPLSWRYEATECGVCEVERRLVSERGHYADRLKELIALGADNLRLHGLLAQAKHGTLKGDGE